MVLGENRNKIVRYTTLESEVLCEFLEIVQLDASDATESAESRRCGPTSTTVEWSDGGEDAADEDMDGGEDGCPNENVGSGSGPGTGSTRRDGIGMLWL